MEEPRSAVLWAHLGELADPRIDRHKEHKLIDILVIAICALLCGANAWVAGETLGKAKRAWLERFLDLAHGIPSHATFWARVCAGVPGGLANVFSGLDSGRGAGDGGPSGGD